MIKKTALYSDNSGLLLLDEDIVVMLKGEETVDEPAEQPLETTQATTAADVLVTESEEEVTEQTKAKKKTEHSTTSSVSSAKSATSASAASRSTVRTTTTAATAQRTAAAPVVSSTTAASSVTTTVPASSSSRVTAVTTAPKTTRELSTAAATSRATTTTRRTTTTTPKTTTTTTRKTTTTKTTTTPTTTTSQTTTTIPKVEKSVVEFTDQNGNVIYQKELESGSDIGKLPEVPPREGYTGKWQIDGKDIPENYTPKGDVTIEAVYTINKYDVTFVTDEEGVDMHDPITVNYGEYLADAIKDYWTDKPYYNGKWQIEGRDVSDNDIVTEDITVTAVYTHMPVTIYLEMIDEYNDNGDYDPYSLNFSSIADVPCDYLNDESFHNNVKSMLDIASSSYTVGKTVYNTSPEHPENIFDIEGLPELTEELTISDIAIDYEYEGQYYSVINIYYVPDWYVQRVTFHDIDGEEISSSYVMYQVTDIPQVPDGCTWVEYTDNLSYYRFYGSNIYKENTDVYCGYEIMPYYYSDAKWQETFPCYVKAYDSLTEVDLKNMANKMGSFSNIQSDNIAGFITEPITDPTQIGEFVTAGMQITGNMNFYAVRASVEYTTKDGKTGTLYWLGDENDNPIFDELQNLLTTGYEWRFDDENGEEFNKENFNARILRFDEEALETPQTAARSKVVEAQTSAP